MKKKIRKEPFSKFIEAFKEKYCLEVMASEHWRDEFLGLYGFVWVRWNNDWTAEMIFKDLINYINLKESVDRDGVLFVKVKEDKIRILCRSKENLDMWQKILFMRLSPTSKILVTDAGNLSFELELSDIEKRILNENTSTNGLRAAKC